MKKVLLFITCGIIFLSCSHKSTSYSSNKIEGLSSNWKYSYTSEKKSPKPSRKDLPSLAFDQSNNKISGSAGCNRLMGSYTVYNDQISFSDISLTRKMCNKMNIENFIVGFLKTVGYYKLENGKLFLYNKNKRSKYIVYVK